MGKLAFYKWTNCHLFGYCDIAHAHKVEAVEEINVGAHRMCREKKCTTDLALQPRVYLSTDCST